MACGRLGSEDPGVWSLFGKPYGDVSAAGLLNLAPGGSVDFDGTGEISGSRPRQNPASERSPSTPTPG